MNTDFKTSFNNHIKKIVDQSLVEQINQAIEAVEKAASKKDIPKLEKLKGFKKGIYYRIRVGGDYRIGVEITDDLVTFAAFGHRSVIYKIYP